ncbi:9355_t:CDS:2, partial [Racocetra fulgida]
SEVPNPSILEISDLPKLVDFLYIQSEVLNPSVPKMSNPPETVNSLHKYKTEPGQAQKFLEYDDEAGFNLIWFFENLDKGTFNEHKDSWVLIYNQEVKRYGPEYTEKELNDLEHEMPGAIYLPIDKKRREDLVK